MTSSPLQGVRVLAIEQYYSGNIGSLYLTRFGAEVIKLEPLAGDVLRGVGPQTTRDGVRRSVSELRTMNGKSSIAVDLRTADGKALLFQLVKSVDVLWTNMKPRSLIDLGITYEALQQANPEIVYSTISGFGHGDLQSAGPYAEWTAFDLIAQGLAGLQYRVEGVGDEPGYNGLPLGDFVTALMAAMGTVMALYRRAREGGAQRVDVAMHDAMVALNELPLGILAFTGKAPPRGRSGTSAPYGAYRTSDGYVNIAVGGDPIWVRFCHAIGQPGLATDPRYAAARNRVSGFEELDVIVGRWTADHTTAEVVGCLSAVNVPCAPIFTLDEVIDSPQVAARDMLVTVEDPIAGTSRIVGNPIKMSGVDAGLALRLPPILAADTVRVLRELGGMSDEAIEDMVRRGVIAVA